MTPFIINSRGKGMKKFLRFPKLFHNNIYSTRPRAKRSECKSCLFRNQKEADKKAAFAAGGLKMSLA